MGSIVIVCLLLLWAAPARAAEYLVAPVGSDTDDGSQLAPWATIQHAADSLSAGDLVHIAPGTYAESVDLTRSGLPGANIVFSGEQGALMVPPPGLSSPEGFDFADAADIGFVVIESIELAGFDETIYLRPGSHDVEIRDCDIHDSRIGVRVIGASQILIENVFVHDNSVVGVTILGGSHDITLRDVVSSGNDDGRGCRGDGDGFAADASTSNITLERCTAQGNSEDGFDLRTHNLLIKESRAVGNTCLGMKLSRKVTVENSLIARNVGTGLRAHAVSPEGTEVLVRHCTIADNSVGLLLSDSGSTPFTATVVNNIITGRGKVLEFGDQVQLTERGNVFDRRVPGSTWDYDHIVRKAGSVAVARYNAQQINDGTWRQESGQGLGSRAGLPGFVDAASGDYHLTGSGLAVDFGLASDGTPFDIEGSPRPRGSAVDAGAFERASVAGTQLEVVAKVTARADDAIEGRRGGVRHITLRGIVGKNHELGLRFSAVGVPPGAAITRAVARLFAVRNVGRDIDLVYRAEAADSGGPFSQERYDISGRSMTSASVADSPDPWVRNAYNESPDISALVGEVISRPGWRKGNSLVLLVDGSDSRRRRELGMYDRSVETAAELQIWFIAP